MSSARLFSCVFVVGFLLLLSDCARKPKFIGIENVDILGVRDSTLQLRLDYIVYNPNKASAELKDSDMLIYYRDELVGKGKLETSTHLEAKDTIRIPIVFDVILTRLVTFYPELMSSEESVFEVRGKNQVSFVVDNVRMRFNDEVTLDTRKIISDEVSKRLKNNKNFRIKSVRLKPAAKLRTTDLETVIRIFNDLPFDYVIHSMELDFHLTSKSSPIAHWALAEPITLLKNSYVDVRAEVTTQNVNLLKGVSLDWIIKRQIDLLVAGEVELEIENQRFKLPIEDSQTVDMTKISGF